jgi:hypothetical protein
VPEDPLNLYVAVIGDMVGSRALDGSRRGAVQTAFAQLMDRLNDEFAPRLQGRFVIALGDEFEGLIHASAASQTIPQLVWRIEETFPDPVIRLGFGLGGIDTPLDDNVTTLDGPAFHHAREAIASAAHDHRLGGVFQGFGQNHDAILNGIARVLCHQRSRWSKQQRRVARLLHRGMRQIEIAKTMSRSRQAVSVDTRAAGWDAYTEGERAWIQAIEDSVQNVLEPDANRPPALTSTG